jgi:predicted dithiol-disulfide oxidoreductase (DUF899 family)
MRSLQQSVEPELVTDVILLGRDGPVKLSDLFGGKDRLFVIHNMGAACKMCTLWADGFNGMLPHLENRAAFVVCSPDPPAARQKFAMSRNWRIRMISHMGTDFAAKMGYTSTEGNPMPGVSVFTKAQGNVLRISDTKFGPGDDFCALWHLFDLLPEGAAGWRPQYSYQ